MGAQFRVLVLEALMPPLSQSSVTLLSPLEPRELSGPDGCEPRTWLLKSYQKVTQGVLWHLADTLPLSSMKVRAAIWQLVVTVREEWY